MDVEKVLKELTLEEKAKLCMGADSWRTMEIERLGIPAVSMADGPHGLRKESRQEEGSIGINVSVPATCFPPAGLASCSFNRRLITQMGEAIAKEAILQDVDIVLGPAVNIKRSPLCGRNFEYVSEDPYLTGEYAMAFINGAQGNGVGTSIKHFAVNNQETLRMNIDAVVDERALREIYLYAFERAVKQAKPYTVMGSYNRINGDYGCENYHTLKELLREEWGFDGVVISDWSAINDRVKGVKAGCDLEMPYSGKARTQEIIEAVKSGLLAESALDEAVRNILLLVKRIKKAEKTKQAKKATLKKESVYEAHHELARRIAADSMVLLKNEGNILPLDPDKRYALIGAFADTPRYQGGGSSHIRPTRLVSTKRVCEEKNLNFTYNPGYEINSERTNKKLIKEAAQAAAEAEIALVFIGLTDIYEFEGQDRKNMSIPPAHIKLLSEVYKANPNTVVILSAGSAVEMDWESKCRGILYASLMGQAGSEALYDILFGKVNPSGKLSETFPLRLSDTPSFRNYPGGNNSVYYMESIYTGYRYYTTAGVDVKYPFGFGLSYTEFTYSGLKADKEIVEEGGSLKLKVKVKNTGEYDGAETLQVYIRNNCRNTFTPDIVLKNFEKVYLKKGEEKEVVFTISYEDFTRYDEKDGWVADTGDYQIFVAASSADLRESLYIQVKGRGRKQGAKGLDTYYQLSGVHFDEEEFKRLYGRELPPLNTNYRPVGLNTPLGFCAHTLTGRILSIIGKWGIARFNRGKDKYAARKALIDSMGEIPIRSMVVMNPVTNLKTGEALVKMMSGRFLSGLKEVADSLKTTRREE